MRAIVFVLSMLLPWQLRRKVLEWLLHYELHSSSRLGLSLIIPQRLIMGPNSRIDNLTICRGLDLLELGEGAIIGRLNWITGYPSQDKRKFSFARERRSALVLHDNAAVTNRHLIDCTAEVVIGSYSTVAGYRTQILTHSIDLSASRQDAQPITIGSYCFLGTGCILLGGSSLPDRSVLGAMSLLNHAFTEELWLYAGTPARPIQPLASDLAYFHRSSGVVR
jgi:acetyltransferase-like isoleucine patch superfamily enzyme